MQIHGRARVCVCVCAADVVFWVPLFRTVLNAVEANGWSLKNTVGSTMQTYVFAHHGSATVEPTPVAPGEETQ